MVLVVILTLRDGMLAGFHAYERRAAAVMARHGGRIDRAIRVPPSTSGGARREVHVVTFPDAEALGAYRADPEMAALAPLRESAIASTEVLAGEDGLDYHADGAAST